MLGNVSEHDTVYLEVCDGGDGRAAFQLSELLGAQEHRGQVAPVGLERGQRNDIIKPGPRDRRRSPWRRFTYPSVHSHPSLIDVRLFGYEPEMVGHVKTPSCCPSLFIYLGGGGDFGSPQRLQLVPLLQFSQFPPDFVEEVGALEAAAVAVEADDDGAEAADQDRGPVHPELLRHHLATRGAVTENTRSAG